MTTYDTHEPLYDAVDAVVVTTPNRFHEECVVDALDAGLDVLVEKPLAHDLTSAERIAAAAREATGFCAVGFHNRFAAPARVLRSAVDEGRFGDLYHVEANYVRRRGVPGRGSWFTDREVAGGGALVDIGTHAVDFALHVLDFPPVVEVTGVTRDTFGSSADYTYLDMWGDDDGGCVDVEDSVSTLLRCADGRSVSLEVAWAANRPGNTEVVVRGSDAGASFDHESGALTMYETSDRGAAHFSDTTVETDGEPAHRTELRRFVEAVRAGGPSPVPVEEALTVQRVVDAVYRSSETGRAVRLDEAATPAASARPEPTD